jgi:tetratricopeptide (TPR) repeat protein
VSIAYCREAVAIADAGGLDDIRAFAECALSHVYLAAGDLRAAIDAGERALAWFAEQGNVWWACRALWALNPAANGLGLWSKSLTYCRRALDYGREVDDLRLKIVGWWRTGATHIQQGDTEAGRRCCEEAIALSPAPFDAAMVKGVMGYGSLKAGRLSEAERALTEAIAWFDQSRLHYTKAVFAVRLAETLVADGRSVEAQGMVREVLRTTRERGHRYLEGVAERVLGDALAAEPAAAAEHLAIAASILDEIGARDELARALMGQARLRLAAGDRTGARPILTRALALFEACGTLDEPPRVRAMLEAVGGGG